jgi:hypothetical protein
MDRDIPAPTESDSEPIAKRKPIPPGVWIALSLTVAITFPVWGWFLYQGWAWVDLREDRRRMGLMQEEAALVTAPPGAELADVRVRPAEWNFALLTDDGSSGPVSYSGSVSHRYAPVSDLAEVTGFYVGLLPAEGWKLREIGCQDPDDRHVLIRAEKRLDSFVVDGRFSVNVSTGGVSARLTAPFHTQERRFPEGGFWVNGDCSHVGIPDDFTPP